MAVTNANIHPVDVVGLGIGVAPGAEALRTIADADVLVAGARLLERFPGHPGRRIRVGSPLGECLEQIAQARSEGLKVAVITGGDPLFFGIGKALAERFGVGGLRFLPAVNAVGAACARLGLPWEALPAVSLHGRADLAPLLAALATAGRAAVYTDANTTPSGLARFLTRRGLGRAMIHVLENMGEPGETCGSFMACEVPERAFSALNLVIADLGDAYPQRPALGRPDGFYLCDAGLITKWPVRAACLAALRLPDRGVLWDVGAGSGSVAVEACALLRAGLVFAVEKKPGRAAMIRENIHRSGAWQCLDVEGSAPEALAALPDPERIFMGGSLGRDGRALEACCARLKPGGRMVINTVLWGSFQTALEYFARLGWPLEAMQLQANQSEPLAGDLRFAGANPVCILAADKPA